MFEKELRLEEIKIPKSRIRTSVEKKDEMERLADSIKKLGLFHPILVDDDYNLIAGFRRLTAFKQLSLEDPIRFGKISARIMPKVDRARALEAEIHENWARKQLRGYELDTALAELKKIYQTMHPETKKGSAMKSMRELGGKKIPTLSEIGDSPITRRVNTPRFAQSMAKTMNVAESTIEKRSRVGEAIIEGKFDEETVEDYKKGLKTHTEMLKMYQEQKKEPESIPKLIQEDIEKPVEPEPYYGEEVNIFSHLARGYGTMKETELEPSGLQFDTIPLIKIDAPDVAWDRKQPANYIPGLGHVSVADEDDIEVEEYEVIISYNNGVCYKDEMLTIVGVRDLFRKFVEDDEFWEEVNEPDEITFGAVSLTEKDRMLNDG